MWYLFYKTDQQQQQQQKIVEILTIPFLFTFYFHPTSFSHILFIYGQVNIGVQSTKAFSTWCWCDIHFNFRKRQNFKCLTIIMIDAFCSVLWATFIYTFINAICHKLSSSSSLLSSSSFWYGLCAHIQQNCVFYISSWLSDLKA